MSTNNIDMQSMKAVCQDSLRLVIANLNRDCRYRLYFYEYQDGKLYNQCTQDNIQVLDKPQKFQLLQYEIEFNYVIDYPLYLRYQVTKPQLIIQNSANDLQNAFQNYKIFIMVDEQIFIQLHPSNNGIVQLWCGQSLQIFQQVIIMQNVIYFPITDLEIKNTTSDLEINEIYEELIIFLSFQDLTTTGQCFNITDPVNTFVFQNQEAEKIQTIQNRHKEQCVAEGITQIPKLEIQYDIIKPELKLEFSTIELFKIAAQGNFYDNQIKDYVLQKKFFVMNTTLTCQRYDKHHKKVIEEKSIELCDKLEYQFHDLSLSVRTINMLNHYLKKNCVNSQETFVLDEQLLDAMQELMDKKKINIRYKSFLTVEQMICLQKNIDKSNFLLINKEQIRELLQNNVVKKKYQYDVDYFVPKRNSQNSRMQFQLDYKPKSSLKTCTSESSSDSSESETSEEIKKENASDRQIQKQYSKQYEQYQHRSQQSFQFQYENNSNYIDQEISQYFPNDQQLSIQENNMADNVSQKQQYQLKSDEINQYDDQKGFKTQIRESQSNISDIINHNFQQINQNVDTKETSNLTNNQDSSIISPAQQSSTYISSVGNQSIQDINLSNNQLRQDARLLREQQTVQEQQQKSTKQKRSKKILKQKEGLNNQSQNDSQELIKDSGHLQSERKQQVIQQRNEQLYQPFEQESTGDLQQDNNQNHIRQEPNASNQKLQQIQRQSDKNQQNQLQKKNLINKQQNKTKNYNNSKITNNQYPECHNYHEDKTQNNIILNSQQQEQLIITYESQQQQNQHLNVKQQEYELNELQQNNQNIHEYPQQLHNEGNFQQRQSDKMTVQKNYVKNEHYDINQHKYQSNEPVYSNQKNNKSNVEDICTNDNTDSYIGRKQHSATNLPQQPKISKALSMKQSNSLINENAQQNLVDIQSRKQVVISSNVDLPLKQQQISQQEDLLVIQNMHSPSSQGENPNNSILQQLQEIQINNEQLPHLNIENPNIKQEYLNIQQNSKQHDQQSSQQNQLPAQNTVKSQDKQLKPKTKGNKKHSNKNDESSINLKNAHLPTINQQYTGPINGTVHLQDVIDGYIPDSYTESKQFIDQQQSREEQDNNSVENKVSSKQTKPQQNDYDKKPLVNKVKLTQLQLNKQQDNKQTKIQYQHTIDENKTVTKQGVKQDIKQKQNQTQQQNKRLQSGLNGSFKEDEINGTIDNAVDSQILKENNYNDKNNEINDQSSQVRQQTHETSPTIVQDDYYQEIANNNNHTIINQDNNISQGCSDYNEHNESQSHVSENPQRNQNTQEFLTKNKQKVQQQSLKSKKQLQNTNLHDQSVQQPTNSTKAIKPTQLKGKTNKQQNKIKNNNNNEQLLQQNNQLQYQHKLPEYGNQFVPNAYFSPREYSIYRQQKYQPVVITNQIDHEVKPLPHFSSPQIDSIKSKIDNKLRIPLELLLPPTPDPILQKMKADAEEDKKHIIQQLQESKLRSKYLNDQYYKRNFRRNKQ